METIFFIRLQSLCNQSPAKDVSGVLKILGLSSSKGTAWKGGAIPKGDILLKLANYFNVSVDYLLGNTDNPTPAAQKEPPPIQDEGRLDKELIQRLCQLSPEDVEKVDAFVQGLLAAREAEAFPPK